MLEHPSSQPQATKPASSQISKDDKRSLSAKRTTDYSEYRHIPEERTQLKEPTPNLPDGCSAVLIDPPTVDDKEPSFTSAPVMDTTNFFADLPIPQQESFRQSRDLFQAPLILPQEQTQNESTARISVRPEPADPTQPIPRRTYYIPSSTHNGQEVKVYYFQGTSPPESFFQNNTSVLGQSVLQGPNVRNVVTSIPGKPMRFENSEELVRRLNITNELNRIEAETSVMAIEDRRRATLDLDTSRQMDEKVGRLNQLFAFKNSLDRQRGDLGQLATIETQDRTNITKRIDDLHAKIDALIAHKKAGLAQNGRPLAVSIIAKGPGEPTSNVPSDRTSFTNIPPQMETYSRVVSKSSNPARSQTVFVSSVPVQEPQVYRAPVVRYSVNQHESSQFQVQQGVFNGYRSSTGYVTPNTTPIVTQHIIRPAETMSVVLSEQPGFQTTAYEVQRTSHQPVIIQRHSVRTSVTGYETGLPRIQESPNEHYDSKINYSLNSSNKIITQDGMKLSRSLVAPAEERRETGQESLNPTSLIMEATSTRGTIDVPQIMVTEVLEEPEMLEDYQFYFEENE